MSEDLESSEADLLGETLLVAPREIRDVVRRCCQVRQIDAGIADQIGIDVLDAQLHGLPAIATFVAALRADVVTASFSVDRSQSGAADNADPTNPYRDGVEVNTEMWTELHEVAEAFLVSAELLDGFE